MAVDLGQVRGLAHAFLDSLDNLEAKEREQQPSAPFGENFNNVLQLAKEAEPTIDARMWPKSVETYESAVGRKLTRSHYVELATYARQVLALLPMPM